jgi:hypothetical protein
MAGIKYSYRTLAVFFIDDLGKQNTYALEPVASAIKFPRADSWVQVNKAPAARAQQDFKM